MNSERKTEKQNWMKSEDDEAELSVDSSEQNELELEHRIPQLPWSNLNNFSTQIDKISKSEEKLRKIRKNEKNKNK